MAVELWGEYTTIDKRKWALDQDLDGFHFSYKDEGGKQHIVADLEPDPAKLQMLADLFHNAAVKFEE